LKAEKRGFLKDASPATTFFNGLLAGLLILMTVLGWRTDWLLRWRFSANQRALEALVATHFQALASAPAEEEFVPQWPYGAFNWTQSQAGDYRVLATAVFPKEHVLYIQTGGFFRSGWGFLYDPNGHVTNSPMHLSALRDGWCTFFYAKE
jgi:hypothetical protein